MFKDLLLLTPLTLLTIWKSCSWNMVQKCLKTYCCWRRWHCWHQKIWKKHIFFSSLLLLTLLTSHLNNYLDCHICLSIPPWFCPCVRGSVRASVVPFVRVSEKKLHFLQYYHKKPLIKVAWYVSWVKNMHPGLTLRPQWDRCHQGEAEVRILNFKQTWSELHKVSQTTTEQELYLAGKSPSQWRSQAVVCFSTPRMYPQSKYFTYS